jgi:predicted nucleic acid-binding protein
MALFLPDTNIFIYAYHGEEPYGSHIKKWIAEKKLVVSSIVAAEFLSGAIQGEENLFEALLDKFGSLPIDTAIARIAANYRKTFFKTKRHLKLPDCLIAASAKLYNATLVSHNISDFPMTDIKKLKL